MKKQSLVAFELSAVASSAVSEMSSPLQMLATVVFLDVLAVNSSCALMKSAGNLCSCLVRLLSGLFDFLELLLVALLLLLCEGWVLALVCALRAGPPNIGGRPLELQICWELIALSNQVVLVLGLDNLAMYSSSVIVVLKHSMTSK